jgi:aryl sulfotransferase
MKPNESNESNGPNDSAANRTRMVIIDGSRDSTQWDGIRPRPGDIVIASCYKSGTTLTQQIVNLLVNGPKEFDRLRDLSPWVDSTHLYPGPELVEALPSPRFLKSHLPFDALPYREDWRYIYLVRDGRDVCVSLFDFCLQLRRDRPFDAQGKPFDYGSEDFSVFWDEWLESGRPDWPLWDHVESWWRARHLPNVMLLHFNALVGDKPAQVRRIAQFLGFPCDDAIVHMVCDHSSLEHMKDLERAGKFGKPGPKQEATFVHKGTNGRWRGRLNPLQIERYFTLLQQRLDPACAAWVRSDSDGDV